MSVSTLSASIPLTDVDIEIVVATTVTNGDWKTAQIGGIITAGQLADINATTIPPTDDREKRDCRNPSTS